MSKYSSKLSLLAAGLAIALVAPSAFAIDLTADSAATKVAAVDVKDNTTNVAMAAFSIGVSNTDLIIGRTTGFSIRVDLANGAKFQTLGAPAIGAALTSTGTPWSATVAAGGAGQSFVVYSVQPVGGSVGIVNGPALSWAADAIVINNASGLATSGNTVSATVTFADPNTAAAILTPKTAVVAMSDNALAFSVDTTASNSAARIDVGASSIPSAGKTRFSPTGALSDAAGVTWFSPGKLVIGVKAGVKSTASSAAAFTWAAGDTSVVTITGNFSAFTAANGGKAVLVAAGGCTSAAPTVVSTGVVTAGDIKFSDTYVNTHNMDICLIASGTKVIDANTTLPVSAVVTRTTAGRTNSGSDVALPMLYNGANAKVDHFNPASNATVQSYLRVTNTSGAAGKLSIKLTCDTGTSPGTAVVNSLGAGQSILIESGNLENGTGPVNVGSGSCASGKGRLDLTGEFGTMAVQNFMRNIISSGVINVNTNNQN
jgi:hypothetical protein